MSKRKKTSLKKNDGPRSITEMFKRAYGESERDVVKRTLRMVRALDKKRNWGKLMEISANPFLPKMLVPIYSCDTPYKIYGVQGWISEEGYTYWLIGLLKANHRRIKNFNCCRLQFNKSLLRGDTDAAIASLDEIDRISFSWWSIESRVNLEKELIGNDTKEQINELLKKFSRDGVDSRIIDLLVLSESTSVQFFIDSIKSKLKEYRGSDLKHAISIGACLSTLSLPLSEDPERRLIFEDLMAYRNESLLDQYVLLKAVVSDIVSQSRPLNSGVTSLLKELALLIDDAELYNLLWNENDENVSDFVQSVVSDYTYGHYNRVVSAIDEKLQSDATQVFGLIEVYARASIYCGAMNCGGTFFNKLAMEFKEVLLVSSDSRVRIEYLKKIVVKFSSEMWAKSLMFHLLSIIDEQTSTDAVELARAQTKCLGALNTPKAKWKDFSLRPVKNGEVGGIPTQRLVRYTPGLVGPVSDREIFPILSDYLKFQAKNHLEHGEVIEAVRFSVSEYYSNRMSVIHLPIRRLVEAVLKIQNRNIECWVLMLIMLDIYGREIGGAYDEVKVELFEEFLLAHHTHRPSELFGENDISDNEFYFLRYICLPAMLDNLIDYESHDEVIHERVVILDRLIALRSDDDLSKEKDKVVETIFADKLRAKIESGKLFVDVQALESHKSHVYQALFEQAKSVKGSSIGLLDGGSASDGNSALDYYELSTGAVASDKRTGVLHKIFLQAVNDFALNDNYGLDKYLSAEVRHTVFVTQLRSCFERSKLVTVQKDEGYESNVYWHGVYNYVNPSILDEIDGYLRKFSEVVDLILKSVNNQFRVAVSSKHDGYIFDFKSYSVRLVQVSDIISESDKFEQFFRGLIDLMWHIAAEGAQDAQNLVGGRMKFQIEIAIRQLESDIIKAKGDVAMLDLMQEIKNATSSFNKEVEVVLNWFRFVGANDLDSVEKLGVVVEASIASFNSIYGHKNKEISYNQVRSDLVLTYRESRALFISLFTLLENAFRYGAEEEVVLLRHNSDDLMDYISVSNKYDRCMLGDPAEFVRIQKSKWYDASLKLSREEGGSGLFKVNNFLTNSSRGFAFDITVEKEFKATIGMRHEDFNNRR
ncbi:hypothetical protein IAE35_12065 [Pseudomonas sp. S75]|uniref:hypothetical protein n=1 Tax=unclassified Pseudomonas TaxID=196821 RepID=UPI00190318CB|nr:MULTISPECIES: hypothetical protein [unclassified Pseudomonas]MBJ9977073.1 hypothetical protein [Pseudomonas sp. S30]MBK0154075.1 hypothetical protein [Pseudomonas sp. S75]